MHCPRCQSDNTVVSTTEQMPAENAIKRYMRCNDCQLRFRTVERIRTEPAKIQPNKHLILSITAPTDEEIISTLSKLTNRIVMLKDLPRKEDSNKADAYSLDVEEQENGRHVTFVVNRLSERQK
jgi:Transcription factor S-II (TFIIS)